MTKHSQPHSYIYHYVRLTPEQQIGLHQACFWELSHVITGSGTRIIGNTEEPFQEGEVILIPPHIPHCWYFDPDKTDKEGLISNITLTFRDDFLTRYMQFPELQIPIEQFKQRKNAIKFNSQRAQELSIILKSMQKENDAERIASILRLILLIAKSNTSDIAGEYQPEVSKEKKRLEQIQIYISCNATRNITLEEMAQLMGMNRASFCIFFKKATGKTFISYLNEFRIEMACLLLKQQQHTIAEICFSTGFNDVPYFNRVFKRIKGITPSEYLCSLDPDS